MTETPSHPSVHGEVRHNQRSQLSGTVVSLIGWVVVILPIIMLAILIFAAVMDPSASMTAPGRAAIAIGGAALLFCMIAAPHLLGQAVIHRERAMWRAALITGIPAACVVLYFAFRFLGNLG
ncbi:hypothetical protein MB46_01490 [Arthrobacter alpinus]|uniref:hypothetical protein n=1 Tax=Arthrobacter alpinus TaxID=656366 RepID=UPI0005C9B329|nr:hypothetical protein [Arthrobacter alpinus]ALV44387.1 hypothetical protein MB46_01490 [Arthrobacter alpinus]